MQRVIGNGIDYPNTIIEKIIDDILTVKVKEYVVTFPLNYLVVERTLRDLFRKGRFLYSDRYINLSIGGTSIDIYFRPDSTKFELKT